RDHEWQVQQCKRTENDRAQQQRRQSRRDLDHDGGAACDEERAEDTGQDGMSGNPRRLRKDSRYEFQIDYLLDAERHHRYGEEKASKRGSLSIDSTSFPERAEHIILIFLAGVAVKAP